MLAKITIIGRPNVGKSSLFNMMTGHKIAIVADEAGTTRDISEFEYTDDRNDLTYILADSGGLDYSSEDDEVAVDITERTERSIVDSDLLVWVVEYDRFTDLDQFIYRVLKKHKVTNFIVLANKADNETKVMESWSMAGKGELEFFPVSSSHNAGIWEVKRFIAKNLVSRGLNFKKGEEDDTLKMAFVGRPNVGKSSIVNTVVWNDRVMVKDMAGTTRDAIDTKFSYGETDFTLIDTAGIRRLSKVGTRNIENWSIMRSERALKRADVIAVVVDGFEWLVQQDLSLIGRCMDEKKWLIIVVNKWDKVLGKPGVDKAHMMERYIEYLKEKIEFLPWVTVIFTSATEKKRLTQILDEAIKIAEERKKRVKTSILNEFLEQAIYKHPPTGNKKSHSPKIYYGTQADTNPPKFVVSVNNPNHFHFSYKRYLENKIRDNFGFHGTPITIEFRGRGKYADITK
jgi:GTP-binding protein